jgi:hypothetical protein
MDTVSGGIAAPSGLGLFAREGPREAVQFLGNSEGLSGLTWNNPARLAFADATTVVRVPAPLYDRSDAQPAGFSFLFAGDPMQNIQLLVGLIVIAFIGFLAVGIVGAGICFWIDLVTAIVR